MATPARSEAGESVREQEELEHLEIHMPLYDLVPFIGIATALAMFQQPYTMRWEARQAPSRLEFFEVRQSCKDGQRIYRQTLLVDGIKMIGRAKRLALLVFTAWGCRTAQKRV